MWFASQGHTLRTGNATGVDQAFARGANQIDPTLVELYLPWRSYNRDAVVPGNVVHVLDDYPRQVVDDLVYEASGFHPAWNKLKQGGRKLMARNGTIIRGKNAPLVELVLAMPSHVLGGGTGQGMRLAEGLGIEVIDLNTLGKSELSALCNRVRANKE
jgi:hypothetical protein